MNTALEIYNETDIADASGMHVAHVEHESQEHAQALARLFVVSPQLLQLAKRLALVTNEGEDLAQGTHYVDRLGLIRCKGSFFDLVETARSLVAEAEGENG